MLTLMIAAKLSSLSVASASPPSAMPLTCESCKVALVDADAATQLKVAALELELARLDLQLEALRSLRPPRSLVLAFIGSSFGPAFTLIGGLLVTAGIAALPALLIPGVAVFAVGALGIGIMVWGWLRASDRAFDPSSAQRLQSRRMEIEKQLGALASVSNIRE